MVNFGTSSTVCTRYQIEKRKVDYEWMHKKKWNAFIGSAYLIAAYAESFVLCVRSSKKLLFKKSRI